MLQLFVSCVGAFGMLLGLVPVVAAGPLGQLLLGGAVLASCLQLFVTARAGRSVVQAIVGLLIFGVLAFGLTYGCVWYFTVYLASQPNIMPFSTTPKP